jgi:uncharacterized protein YbbK (DUF523 family)
LTPKKIVSACLAGFHCRFDCASKERAEIKAMVESGEAIPVCPEQMGGLSTPREPSEIVNDRVITLSGTDVTDAFQKGAQEALKMAIMVNSTEAYLKSKSPSCGMDLIYDGSFSGKLVSGDGVFAKLLKERGIKIHIVD